MKSAAAGQGGESDCAASPSLCVRRSRVSGLAGATGVAMATLQKKPAVADPQQLPGKEAALFRNVVVRNLLQLAACGMCLGSIPKPAVLLV